MLINLPAIVGGDGLDDDPKHRGVGPSSVTIFIDLVAIVVLMMSGAAPVR